MGLNQTLNEEKKIEHFPIFTYRTLHLKKINIVYKWSVPSSPLNRIQLVYMCHYFVVGNKVKCSGQIRFCVYKSVNHYRVMRRRKIRHDP